MLYSLLIQLDYEDVYSDWKTRAPGLDHPVQVPGCEVIYMHTEFFDNVQFVRLEEFGINVQSRKHKHVIGKNGFSDLPSPDTSAIAGWVIVCPHIRPILRPNSSISSQHRQNCGPDLCASPELLNGNSTDNAVLNFVLPSA